MLIPALFGLMMIPVRSVAQKQAAYDAIEQLHDGVLVLRIPTQQTKIDTLEAMLRRSTDATARKRLEKELTKTIEDRDQRSTAYRAAFQSEYDFSAAAYLFDRELLTPATAQARFFTPAGDSVVALSAVDPARLFYLRFERTSDSGIEALILYGPDGRIPPEPFPAEFALGGLSNLWNSLMGKSHEMWRIRTMNKRFGDFLHGVRSIQKADADKP